MDAEPKSPALSILLASGRSAEERVRDLLPEMYEQLRAAARNALRGERRDHSLQATALVHEAYLRIAGPREIPWESRAHFYAAAAQAMRRILVDHARARAARAGARIDARAAAVELAGLPAADSDRDSSGFLILDEAIERLESVDAEAARVVRLRYFAGLGVEDTASALGVSAPTVERAWAFARGWLKEAIESGRA